jgi:glycerol-3-phosphate cytidylyltransferase
MILPSTISDHTPFLAFMFGQNALPFLDDHISSATQENLDIGARYGVCRAGPGGKFTMSDVNLPLGEHTIMIRIGYAPGAYDLFHVGHLNLLRRAKEQCDFLIAGVVADDVLIQHKGITPVISLAERLEIVRSVRFVDAALPAMTNDKVEIWQELRFNVLFKGSDWQGTDKGNKLERDFSTLGVEVVYLPYTLTTSSTQLRRALKNIELLAQSADNRHAA